MWEKIMVLCWSNPDKNNYDIVVDKKSSIRHSNGSLSNQLIISYEEDCDKKLDADLSIGGSVNKNGHNTNSGYCKMAGYGQFGHEMVMKWSYERKLGMEWS